MNQPILILKRSASKSIFLAVLFGLAFTTNGFAATDPDPCAANPANRQLDYWLGNWKIGAEGSSGNAHSTVTLSLDKCLVVENWDGGRGHYGQNVFGYGADDESWYGMFADNEGRVHVFTSGKVADGKAEFKGTSRGTQRRDIEPSESNTAESEQGRADLGKIPRQRCQLECRVPRRIFASESLKR